VSLTDDFMSKVINLDEKEKEETILFLAEALINDNYEFLKLISPKVQNIVLPFLTSIAVKGNEKIMKKCECYLCKEEKECTEQILYEQNEYRNVYICTECNIKKYGRR